MATLCLSVLQEGQQELELLTASTLESVSNGHQSLMEEQEKLRVTQRKIQDSATLNLREMMHEKALITSGHEELSKMMGDVRKKLGEYDLAIWIFVLENSPP
jgi:hypothetical protein